MRRGDVMADLAGVKDPTIAPLLPGERAWLTTVGKDPEAYTGLWIHPVPDERGIQFYSPPAAPDATFVQFGGVLPSTTFVRKSALVLTPETTESLDILSWGLRLVVAKAQVSLPTLPDCGWIVQGLVSEASLPPVLRARAFYIDGVVSVETLTLYEAQAVMNLLFPFDPYARMVPASVKAESTEVKLMDRENAGIDLSKLFDPGASTPSSTPEGDPLPPSTDSVAGRLE